MILFDFPLLQSEQAVTKFPNFQKTQINNSCAIALLADFWVQN
ncbi:hypothetical protein KsCSTR_49120 [Candidatus Kuenenia stuttgartiensis]|uniref:Uncharacterized protein n=1 Tax=Kuenenia stuttgartiensis TaxID=174633 RepID=A0A6G7GYE5_KUEST|nr:hypothetical protein KsCSTR_49120 [Candidatus Kuenenia stuttgartiensis]